MSLITVENALTASHGCGGANPIATNNQTVFINNLKIVVVGDTFTPHSYCKPGSDHTPKVTIGSPTVFIAGKAVHRMIDVLDCEDLVSMNPQLTVFCYS